MLSIILGALLVATWLGLFVVAVSPRIQFWLWGRLMHRLHSFIDNLTKHGVPK